MQLGLHLTMTKHCRMRAGPPTPHLARTSAQETGGQSCEVRVWP